MGKSYIEFANFRMLMPHFGIGSLSCRRSKNEAEVIPVDLRSVSIVRHTYTMLLVTDRPRIARAYTYVHTVRTYM